MKSDDKKNSIDNGDGDRGDNKKKEKKIKMFYSQCVCVCVCVSGTYCVPPTTMTYKTVHI